MSANRSPLITPEQLRPAQTYPSPNIDAQGLEMELRKGVEGEVRFDAGSKALYAVDASNYRQVPIGVVVPKSVDDVVATIAACRRFNAPVLSRGGGTSLAGQCCNVAVVIDWSNASTGPAGVDVAQTIVIMAVSEVGAIPWALRPAVWLMRRMFLRAYRAAAHVDPAPHFADVCRARLGNPNLLPIEARRINEMLARA